MLNLDALKDNLKTMLANIENKIQNIALLPQFGAFYNRAKKLNGLLDKYTNSNGGELPVLSEEDYAQILDIMTEMSSEKQLFDLNVYRYYGVMNYWPNFAQRYWRSIAEQIQPYKDIFSLFDFKKPDILKNMFEAAVGLFVANVKEKVTNFDREKFATGKKFEFVYVDKNNNKVNGYFQADKRFVIKSEYNIVASQVACDYPTFAQFFNHLANNVDFNNAAKELKDLPYCFDVEKNDLNTKMFLDIINKANLGEKANKFVKSMLKDEGFKIALFDFSRKIARLNKKYDVNINKLGLTENESLTQRTSAVSKIANMVGLSDVIPEAENMQVSYNEVTYNGVFEKKAVGVELGNIANSDLIRTYTKDQFESKDAIKAMAKLQVLDFITGNVNRDKNKLFLKFEYNDEGKAVLKGIQGISNKSSFTNKKVGADEKLGNMPSLKALKVIDKETADKIATMTESQLKNTLSTFNMSKEAIDEAWNRCQSLQELIKNKDKSIKIMEDQDWDKVKLNELVGKNEKESNYFNILDDIPNMLKKPRELNTELNKDRYIQGYLLNVEVNTIIKEIVPFMDELKKADKTVFKKNSKCSEVFDNFNKVINDLTNTELKDEDETRFVAYIDMSLIAVQSKIAEIRYNIMDKKNYTDLSDKDKQRVDALNNIDRYIYAKMDILNKKYGDKAETQMKIDEDIIKCSIEPRKELADKLKNSLEVKEIRNNGISKVADTNKNLHQEKKKDDVQIDPLKKKNN